MGRCAVSLNIVKYDIKVMAKISGKYSLYVTKYKIYILSYKIQCSALSFKKFTTSGAL